MEDVRFHSAHLLLRNLRPSDCDSVLAYRSDPEVCRYIGEPMSAAEVAAHIDRCAAGWSRTEGETLNLGVELVGADGLIGEVLIRYISAKSQQVEMGLALARRRLDAGLSRVRAHLGLETCLAVFRYCFEE